jgi:hypothetical protein
MANSTIKARPGVIDEGAYTDLTHTPVLWFRGTRRKFLDCSISRGRKANRQIAGKVMSHKIRKVA